MVEDEAAIRDMTIDFLGEAGLSTIEAATADIAMNLLETQGEQVCLLFTDVRMPGHMDGLDLAKKTMELWPHIKVIVTSGMFNRNTDTVPEGADFIAKPWLPLEMLTMVTRAAAQHCRN